VASSCEWQVIPVQYPTSRCRFLLLVSEQPAGRQIVIHLESLFRQYGVPLFLKRDNGSPLKFCDGLIVVLTIGPSANHRSFLVTVITRWQEGL
jgi:hypothetical protein